MKIIAEVGSCWQTFEHCKDAIQLAKNCGADAVKFQLYDSMALYGIGEGGETKGSMDPDWLPKLKDKADACGIEFMCSAFSPELIDVVDPFVETHKVASAELTHVRMLEKLAKINKPVILSTGASGMADIEIALKILGNTPVTLLYCVSSYPARVVDFGKLIDMRKVFGDKYAYGYSDHTTDVIIIPVTAENAGATVIEKHVNFFDVECPDSPHSLSLDEFQIMCDVLKGRQYNSMNNGEKSMYTTHNRRLIAIKDIAQGDLLKEGINFGIYRSLKAEADAFSPWFVNEVSGKIAQANVCAGDGIGPKVVIFA